MLIPKLSPGLLGLERGDFDVGDLEEAGSEKLLHGEVQMRPDGHQGVCGVRIDLKNYFFRNRVLLNLSI